MPPKTQSKKRAASKTKAKERKEKKLLEESKKNAAAKCEEARAFLEPTKKNAEPNYVKAKAALDAAQELYDADPFLFYLFGEWHRRQDQYEDAIGLYTKVLDMDPHYLRALDSRASCYQAQGDLKHALEDYTSYIAMDPENDHAYNMRGLCILNGRVPGLRLKSADFEKCVSNFTRAIELNEANYYAWANLGKAHEDQGNLSKARECYTSSLGIKEDYAYAQFRRGCVALLLAEETLKNLAEDDDDSSLILPIATSQGSPSGLVSSRPQDLTPQDVEKEVKLKIAREEQVKASASHLDSAERDLLGLVDTNPEANQLLRDPSVMLNLGVCCLLRNQLKKADEYFKEVDDIIAGRPMLVEEGAADSIENVAIIKDVLAMRREEIKARRSTQG